jgi:hypothetical protein
MQPYALGHQNRPQSVTGYNQDSDHVPLQPAVSVNQCPLDDEPCLGLRPDCDVHRGICRYPGSVSRV